MQADNYVPRLRLETAEQLLADAPQRWLVEGVIPAGGFCALFGPSGAGKSFLALDMCVAVSTGSCWFGYRVDAAPVTYLCLEGADGFRKRAKALALHRVAPLPANLRFVRQSFELRNRSLTMELATVMRSANAGGGLLVIDTLSRACGDADENSSSDMGAIVTACNRLQQETGGAVLVIHHTGKDAAKGLRGHSSLRGALDAALEVRRTRVGREWLVSKSKDGEEGASHPFRLRNVTVETNAHGEPVTSCVVEATTSAEPVARAEKPQGDHQVAAARMLTELLAASQATGRGGAPSHSKCVLLEQAVATIAPQLDCEKTRQGERARNAISRLVEKKLYSLQGGWLWSR